MSKKRHFTWDENGILHFDGEPIEMDILEVTALKEWVEWELSEYFYSELDIPRQVEEMPEPPSPYIDDSIPF